MADTFGEEAAVAGLVVVGLAAYAYTKTAPPLRTISRMARTAPPSSAVPAVSSAGAALKHRPIMPFKETYSLVANDVFVAPSATVVGDVQLHDGSSVWYNAVIRGDLNKVKVCRNAVVGDRVTITTAASLESGFPAVVEVGQGATIGAGSALKSCIIMEDAIIGENCVIGEGALVEAGAEVGPGSVVPPGRLVPAGERWAGNPVAFVGKAALPNDIFADSAEKGQQKWGGKAAASYDAARHADEFLPYNTAFWKTH